MTLLGFRIPCSLQLEANNEQLETMAKDLEREREKTDVLLKVREGIR